VVINHQPSPVCSPAGGRDFIKPGIFKGVLYEHHARIVSSPYAMVRNPGLRRHRTEPECRLGAPGAPWKRLLGHTVHNNSISSQGLLAELQGVSMRFSGSSPPKIRFSVFWLRYTGANGRNSHFGRKRNKSHQCDDDFALAQSASGICVPALSCTTRIAGFKKNDGECI